MRKFLFSFLLVIGCSGFAQEKKPLVLNELMTNRALLPQSLTRVQWWNATAIIYQEKNSIEIVNFVTKTRKTLFTLDELNESLKKSGLKTLSVLPAFKAEGDYLAFFADERYLQLEPLTLNIEIITSIPTGAQNIDVFHSARKLAYTREQDHVLMLLDNDIKFRVSTEVREGVKDGGSVHRNEFGINKGTFFSPNGRFLAFYSMDESMVTQYPLVDINTRIATVKNDRYPMAGMNSHRVRVGVCDIENHQTTFLKSTFDRETYHTNIAWSPDSKAVYVAMLTRNQKKMSLCEYSPENGRLVKTLFEETSPRYVEPENPMVFVPAKPDLFVWQSQRDGYNHLYLYNTEGKLIRQITQGDWVVKELIGFSAKGDKIYFMATKDSPLETHLYSTSVSKSGAIERITKESGTHRITANSDGSLFIDQYSNFETPNTVQVINPSGKVLETLLKSPNPLKDYTLGTTTIQTVKAADGKTDLYARMIKPYNFDETKKYPVIIYVYGGPHSQLVNNSWLGGANLFLNFLAQQGYIVWTMDGRGTRNRGFEFESAIHRQVGTPETADQMEGVKYLKSLPCVDSTRIGVDGWSYGGFLTISLKLRYPGVFKVATAGGPVIDWKWYEIMYGERYMETPEDNPDGYKTASLLNYVDHLQGKLLIIHGGQDNTVVWQHSLSFINECIRKNKQVDYFVYPTHEHNVRGADRTHLLQKLYDYYRENL